jgi:hypothetical protein
MKKIIILFVAVCVATASAIAAPAASPVSEKAKASFNYAFKNAEKVQWTNLDGLYMVNFKLNDETILAWYTEEGELEAVQRIINIDRVSFIAAQSINEIGLSSTISTIAEVNQQGELFYLVKSENETHRIMYKVLSNGAVSKLTKKKKL